MRKRASKVVLVGRPNVGKSTLFNRITGSRRAIVTSVAGTTRDVIEQSASWRDTGFVITDTGGMFGDSEDPLQPLVVENGRRAIASADLFVLVADGREGLVPGDRDIATEIRATGQPVMLAINKMDDKRARNGAMEFYQLGFEPVVEISAEHGQGVADLLDEIVARLPERSESADEATGEGDAGPELGIAIIGRPNVGKSSLVNRLLREERVLVSEVPGTTRDAIETHLKWHRRQFRIVDTAGIRKPGRVSRGGQIEEISVLSARRAVEHADVVVLVVDATVGAMGQDGAIAGAAERAGCSVIIAANKWDLVKGQGDEFVKHFDEDLRDQLKFLDYAPIHHLSALTGERTARLLDVIDKVAAARLRRVTTSELNRFFAAATAAHPPPARGQTPVRILYAAQTGVSPPRFALFTNVATSFHFSYERYLINKMRDAFGFVGTPVRLQVRRRAKSSKRGA